MDDPAIDTIQVSAYTVPTEAPEADGTIAWDSMTLVLVQVTGGDALGTGWTYAPTACGDVIHETPAAVVQDRSGWDVTGAHEAMVRAARAREIIEPRAELFVDASGAYTRKQAVRLMQLAADLDVHWFEEPVSSDDVIGLQVSGHCAPHLHVHVATATANVRHLEWSHDHVGIESMFFDGTLDPTGGSISPRDAPGNRLELRAADADTYRVGGVPGRRRAFRDVAHDRECPGCGKPLLPAMSNPWGLVSRLHVDLRRHASAFCRP